MFLFLRRTGLIVLLLLVIAAPINFFRPLPAASQHITYQAPLADKQAVMTWPKYGQSAIGAEGFGVLDATPTDQSVPIASTAKLLTAIAVLQKKPLEIGQQGPSIPITAADIASYKSYLAEDGSVVPVAIGEKITEYQALQAMLIPSANNMAETLARWAYGSITNYVNYANKLASQMDMKTTAILDASGFSPNTVSTAHDLVLLGEKAMAVPVIAQITNQKSAVVPMAGKVTNTNTLLGTDGINGLKTGNTDQAGGCFVFSSNQTINDQSVTIIGAIVGASDKDTAIKDSTGLIDQAKQNFVNQVVVAQNQVVGTYQTAWGKSANIISSATVSRLVWKGQTIKPTIRLNKIKTVKAGSRVGNLTFTQAGTLNYTNLTLQNDLPGPAWTWRLFR